MWTEDLFRVKQPVIALLHLRALPGDPLFDKEGGLQNVIDIARRELHALQDGGWMVSCLPMSSAFLISAKSIMSRLPLWLV